jgi:hypothetical protein
MSHYNKIKDALELLVNKKVDVMTQLEAFTEDFEEGEYEVHGGQKALAEKIEGLREVLKCINEEIFNQTAMSRNLSVDDVNEKIKLFLIGRENISLKQSLRDSKLLVAFLRELQLNKHEVKLALGISDLEPTLFDEMVNEIMNSGTNDFIELFGKLYDDMKFKSLISSQ